MNANAILADFAVFASGRDTPPDEGGRHRLRMVETANTSDVTVREDPDALAASAIRQGDETAFRALFDAYVDRLTMFAITLLNDRAAAQDIVADVFFAVWRIRLTWQPDRVAVYLFGAVRNRCYNYRSSLAARNETVLEAMDVVPAAAEFDASAGIGGDTLLDEALDAETLIVRIEQALTGLPVQRRAVALLRWREELSFPEIASALGISENAARLHVSRALKAIRHLIPGPR